uniref:Anthranilate synthase component 2 n=1 Tax=Gastroclonium compressum TaxID=1852973 RepID=A0A173FZR7_GASCM|nr:anthranilate synthase component II [Coeloseira compressa]ANH09524.1 anthranilate synthase component II [Coeloseira compressa]
MILIIDNYDSFTQNLVQYVGELGFSVQVMRNNLISINEINILSPTHIIISPGPGSPDEISYVLAVIKYFSNKIPILGVCLGHQSIGYVYGSRIYQLNYPMHGKISDIWHSNTVLFKGLNNPFVAARYHSLLIDKNNLSKEIEVIAWTQDNQIMGIRHRKYKLLQGIQFHPESLWTHGGKLIIKNFLFLI